MYCSTSLSQLHNINCFQLAWFAKTTIYVHTSSSYLVACQAVRTPTHPPTHPPPTHTQRRMHAHTYTHTRAHTHMPKARSTQTSAKLVHCLYPPTPPFLTTNLPPPPPQKKKRQPTNKKNQQPHSDYLSR